MPRPAVSVPSTSAASCASRARIQFRLPRIVLISPLCAISRYGCASGQDGKVLVEKRACTSAIAEAYSGSDRSGKNASSCIAVSMPLYTMVALDRLARYRPGLVLDALAQAVRLAVERQAGFARQPGNDQLGQPRQH